MFGGVIGMKDMEIVQQTQRGLLQNRWEINRFGKEERSPVNIAEKAHVQAKSS